MKYLLIALLSGIGAANAYAQQPMQQLMKELNSISSENVSYNYLLRLTATSATKATDSIRGKLARFGNDYYDSSNTGITTVSGRYYCKIDFSKRRMTVYDMELIRRKLNLNRKHVDGLHVVDSLIAKARTVQLDTTTNRGKVWIKYSLAGGSGGNCSLLIDRKTSRLLQLNFEAQSGNEAGYVRSYAISGISARPNPAVLNLSRFFTIEGSHVKPVGRFAQYSLKELIN